MAKNILIVDDSALMRRLLSDIIKKDNRFSVADVARDGVSTLNLIKKEPQKYDVILLDFFMPDMNGDELIKKLVELKVEAKIILISGVIQKDAMEIIEALENGAFDFVTKPNSFLLTKENAFEKKLIQRIELAVSVLEEDRKRKKFSKTVKEKASEQPISIKKSKVIKQKGSVRGDKLVALACSTGGPKALHQVIPKLPKNLDAPMIIVQHMPSGFTNSLAIRLNDMSAIHVKEAENGEVLQKGTVYIAKGGSQLRVKKEKGQYVLQTTNEPARGGLRPCADIMYESLMESDFKEIVCVVLTGMGGDGTAGIKQLNQTNNIYAIAQNEETCTVYGMPRVLIESGLVDEVVPLQNVADAIQKQVGVQ